MNRFTPRNAWVFSIALFACAFSVVTTLPGDEAAVSRWETAIVAFEKADAESMPAEGVTVFVGSSSIRMWDLKKFLPELDAINRGFGGSQIADSVEFADRIIIKYKPKTIVFYAGDNDIAAGKSSEQVAADFKALWNKIHAALPETNLIFIAIKPSLARWELVGKMREANGLIRAFCEKEGGGKLHYLDVDAPMLGKDGKPRADLFVRDGLHLNDEGYALWTGLLNEALQDVE